MQRPKILPGLVIAEITSADIPGFLNVLTNNGIVLQNIRHCDELTVRISVNRQVIHLLVVLAERHGAVIKNFGSYGLYYVANRMMKRPILMAFALVVLFLNCYLPSRILFITVEGNVQVPERYIVEMAAECGINFGASKRLVRSEKMKNNLLEKVPQLQWAGINTFGCTAIISVSEKTLGEEHTDSNHSVASIVAGRDGVIQSCTVLQGTPLCAVGQAVKAGQMLVSGYVDCGIVIKTTRAEAEIKALTFRDLEIVAPTPAAAKGDVLESKSRYSLKIGKKLLKLYKDSGNLHTTCDKIYLEEYLYLPGGFQLPVAIVVETEIYYKESREALPVSDTGEWLKIFANDHLKEAMISGAIVSADAEVIPETDVLRLRGKYTCLEMIGQIKNEETLPKDDEK